MKNLLMMCLTLMISASTALAQENMDADQQDAVSQEELALKRGNNGHDGRGHDGRGNDGRGRDGRGRDHDGRGRNRVDPFPHDGRGNSDNTAIIIRPRPRHPRRPVIIVRPGRPGPIRPRPIQVACYAQNGRGQIFRAVGTYRANVQQRAVRNCLAVSRNCRAIGCRAN